MSKKNEKDDNLTVSKVYETLKSPAFQRDLYWDVLSSIREKNTYKLMKDTTEKLINQRTDALDDLTDSESDKIFRKTIVAQICSMTYAIDTVYSKILYMKLEKAWKSEIPNLIRELRNEGKIPDEIWSKLQFKSDISEPQSSSESSKVTNNANEQKAETSNKPATTSGRRKRKESSTNEDDKKASDTNYKDALPNDAGSKKADLPKKKLGGRIQTFRKKSIPFTSTPNKKLTEGNVLSNASAKISEDSTVDIPKNSFGTDNPDSDAESEISVGHISLASVSSVHTSDLSSFDDEISLSSEDEENGKKKRLSLKDLQKKFCQNGNISSKTAEGLNGTKLKKSPSPKESCNKKTIESKEQENKESTNKKAVESEEQGNEENHDKKSVESKGEENEASTVDTPGSPAESVSSQSPKGLFKRVRKPNSRYSSDNILCMSVKVKERKKSVIAVKNTSEKDSSDELSPKKKKPRTESDDMDVETSDETQKKDNEKNSTDSDVKSPSKQYDSSDLYKPHSAVRSLTSRRTAPVTLYST